MSQINLTSCFSAETVVECSICYEELGSKNNCTTPCGHVFCFNCMMQSLGRNNTCPCCRAVLQEEIKESDDEEEYEEESDGEEEEEEDDEFNLRGTKASAKVIAEKFTLGGFTMEDVIAICLQRCSASMNFERLKDVSETFERIVRDEDSRVAAEHEERQAMSGEDTRRRNRISPSLLDSTKDQGVLGGLFA